MPDTIVAVLAEDGLYCLECAQEFAILADGTRTEAEVAEPCCEACGVTGPQSCYSCGESLAPGRFW